MEKTLTIKPMTLDMDKLVKSITIAVSAIYEIYKLWKTDSK